MGRSILSHSAAAASGGALSRRRCLKLAGAHAGFAFLAACDARVSADERASSIRFEPGESIAAAEVLEPGAAADAAAVGTPFRMNFAPHFGLFEASAGSDLVSQIEFGAAHGFRAWEDNTLTQRSPAAQNRIAETLNAHGMQMGVFTIGSAAGYSRPSIVTGGEEELLGFLNEIRTNVELASFMSAKWVMVNPGMADPSLEINRQLANVVDAFRHAVDIAAEHDVVMVLEPTNSVGRTPRVLQSMDAGYLVCKAVDSPNLKLLFDTYQQQLMDGNIVNSIDSLWDEIAYFQIADLPGRAEPMTGEINYLNVLRHIRARGYQGIVGMEHRVYDQSVDGELKMIAAYRALDAAF